MKSCSILFFILVFVNLKSNAQSRDSLLSIYNNQTIYRNGTKFMKGSEKLSFQDLKSVFYSGTTRELYHKSKTRLTLNRIFNLASLGLIIISAFTPTNTAGNIEFIAGTSILGLGGIYYHDQSSKYLDKAIWLKNREVIFGTNH